MDMEIIVRHSVYLKNVDLGKGFSNVVVDLIVDKLGWVNVCVGSKLSFYTDLDRLPFEILDAISKVLEKEAGNRILARIEERVSSNIRIRKEERQRIVERALEDFQ